MENEKKILEIIEKKGLITNKDIIDNNIPKSALNSLIKKADVEKVKNGVYNLKDTLTDEYYLLLYGNKDAVYSYFTALYFHGLCEMVPQIYDITVKKNYGGNLQKNKKVRLHYVEDTIFELGKTTIKSPQGQEIIVYDVERCLCDIIKNQENLYFEYVKYAFNEYYRVQKHDTFKLYKYARIMGIEEKVSNFMGVLL